MAANLHDTALKNRVVMLYVSASKAAFVGSMSKLMRHVTDLTRTPKPKESDDEGRTPWE